MAAIGTFTAQSDGYAGSIKTLTLDVKSATFRPNEGGRQAAGLPHLRGPDGMRRRLEEDVPREPGIPLGQAGRSELPGTDLRLDGRG